MKYFTTILALASVLNFTSASPSTGVIPIRRAEGIHKREPLLEIRTTSGEQLYARDMSPNDGAVLLARICCHIKCGPDPGDFCCCGSCCTV